MEGTYRWKNNTFMVRVEIGRAHIYTHVKKNKKIPITLKQIIKQISKLHTPGAEMGKYGVLFGQFDVKSIRVWCDGKASLHGRGLEGVTLWYA